MPIIPVPGDLTPLWPSWALHSHASHSYMEVNTNTQKIKMNKSGEKKDCASRKVVELVECLPIIY